MKILITTSRLAITTVIVGAITLTILTACDKSDQSESVTFPNHGFLTEVPSFHTQSTENSSDTIENIDQEKKTPQKQKLSQQPPQQSKERVSALPDIKSLEAWAIQAKAGDIDAQVQLSTKLSEYKIPAYDRMAFYWAEQATKAGDLEAQKLLARFYEEGIGTDVNPNTAFYLYHDLSQRLGDAYPPAYLPLAKFYIKGQGIDTNPYLAGVYLAKAIEYQLPGVLEVTQLYFEQPEQNIGEPNETVLNFALNTNIPGALYFEGKRLLENSFEDSTRERGMLYVKTAAEKGYPLAQREMALIYENALYTQENINMPLSLYWYQQAANQGDEFSQYRLNALTQPEIFSESAENNEAENNLDNLDNFDNPDTLDSTPVVGEPLETPFDETTY